MFFFGLRHPFYLKNAKKENALAGKIKISGPELIISFPTAIIFCPPHSPLRYPVHNSPLKLLEWQVVSLLDFDGDLKDSIFLHSFGLWLDFQPVWRGVIVLVWISIL